MSNLGNMNDPLYLNLSDFKLIIAILNDEITDEKKGLELKLKIQTIISYIER
jgi:hypothetical protein